MRAEISRVYSFYYLEHEQSRVLWYCFYSRQLCFQQTYVILCVDMSNAQKKYSCLYRNYVIPELKNHDQKDMVHTRKPNIWIGIQFRHSTKGLSKKLPIFYHAISANK